MSKRSFFDEIFEFCFQCIFRSLFLVKMKINGGEKHKFQYSVFWNVFEHITYNSSKIISILFDMKNKNLKRYFRFDFFVAHKLCKLLGLTFFSAGKLFNFAKKGGKNWKHCFDWYRKLQQKWKKSSKFSI